MIQAPSIVRENENTNQRGPMSTALTTPSSNPDRGAHRATIMLGDERVAVRVGSDGTLRRVMRRVRLYLGTDLYIAKDTGPSSKVSPYQPGYMKLVAGAGGLLGCPPITRDPVTGETIANPKVEFYGSTGVVRSVTATAVCVVRNPATGAPIPSRATIMLDCEHIFRQALLKLGTRDDAVRYMTREDYDADKRGELKGWAFLDMGPIGAAYNMRNPAVMEAYQTFINQGATARQRAMSKAERLACDHNAGTRLTWEKGMLTPHPEGGPSFVDVPVVAWVEERDQAAAEAFMAELATKLSEDVTDVFRRDEGDDDDLDDDVDPADAPRTAYTAPTAALPDHGERPPVIVPRPEPEKVEAKIEPKPVEPTPPTGAGLTDMRAMLAEIGRLESRLTPPVQDKLRTEADVSDPLAACSTKKVRAYLAALRAEVGE